MGQGEVQGKAGGQEACVISSNGAPDILSLFLASVHFSQIHLAEWVCPQARKLMFLYPLRPDAPP